MAGLNSDRKTTFLIGNHRVTFSETMETIATCWRAFEKVAVSTPYQRFDWLWIWHRTIGIERDIVPLIVQVETQSGQLVALLPLGSFQRGPVRIAAWLGDQHSNYFMGLFRPDGSCSSIDWTELFRALGKAAGIDVFVLKNQPSRWDDLENPIRLPRSRPSPTDAYHVRLEGDFETLLENRPGNRWKRQLRTKARKIEATGTVRYKREVVGDEAMALLDTYFEQKAERFARQGIPDPFATPSARRFFRTLIEEQDVDDPLFELYGLTVDDEIISIYGGSAHRGRFSTSITSIAESGMQQFSPGELLLSELCRDRFDRADAVLDLGIGKSRTKMHWCDDPDELFDAVFPVSLLGTVAAFAARIKLDAKGRIKKNDNLWDSYTQFRKLYRNFFK